MEKRTLLLALATTATLELQGVYCPDGFTRVRPVRESYVNPALDVMSNFFGNIASPFTGDRVQYLVFGGSMNYSTLSYPQFALYDFFQAVQEDSSQFGGDNGAAKNNEKFSNYFWGAYGGYHVPFGCNWDIGVELGFKKVCETRQTANIRFAGSTPGGNSLVPFRNTTSNVWDLLFVVKYQTLSGFNLFLKAGGAQVRTFLTQGNFLAIDNAVQSGSNAFGSSTFNYVNIYPEIELGAGFRFLDHFEFHLSYAKIIAPTENDLISTTAIFFRPRRSPGIDIFTASLEMLLF